MAPKSYRNLVEVGPARQGEGLPTTPEYRSYFAKDGLVFPPGVETLYQSWQRSVSLYANEACLGARTETGYSWITYKEADKRVAAVAGALSKLGQPRDARVGIYGPNSVEWMLTMQACNRQTYAAVPLYDTLGEDAVRYILDHGDVGIVFAQAAKLGELAPALAKAEKKTVETVVYWGAASTESVAKVKAAGGSGGEGEAPSIRVISFGDLLASGLNEANPVPADPPKPEDLCSIMYTSGTTGDPKGVELTHRAVLASLLGLSDFVKSIGLDFGVGDTMFSFLPLAHIFDRVAEEYMLYCGAGIGYWRGDPKLLVSDVSALRPTLFCGVPRVFDRIYATVTHKVQHGGALKRALFNYAYNKKVKAIMDGTAGPANDKATPLLDRLVFKKISAALGGRCRIIVSGGAPLSLRTELFLRAAFCCRIVQGYGLTETSAATLLSQPQDKEQIGTAGVPTSAVSFRLEAVPELNANPLDPEHPRGELCVRGPETFRSYYKNPELAREAIDSDGFFHTGDVVELLPSGALKIVDRKKNIFKLAQGEYIAVEKIEAVYTHAPSVEQVWVYGNSEESQLIGVVVPKETFISKHGGGKKLAELQGDKEFVRIVLADLDRCAKEGKLKGFEKIKAVHLATEPFSTENDLLTPSFKYKRPVFQRTFQKEIDALYASLR